MYIVVMTSVANMSCVPLCSSGATMATTHMPQIGAQIRTMLGYQRE